VQAQVPAQTEAQDDLEIARLAKAARRGEALRDDDFSGPASLVDLPRPVLGCVTHEPSPYADYNGAGLLYFASYVTIADTAERAIVRSRGLAPATVTSDWALGTSAIRRDVFYYANLALGDSLIAELLDLQLVRDASPDLPPNKGDDDHGGGQGRLAVKTRMRLRHARTGHTIADLVTLRLLVSRDRERVAGRRP
jgi:probable biosynthetic protein (TIGR04098 family)